MADKQILHVFSPTRHVSPFDVNMAIDAGYDAVIPYIDVGLKDITGLVHDAIFSRSPQDGAKTGIFLGGKDALGALDMLEAAKKAMVPPFVVSVFADPGGSFTTAAAMVARAETALRGTRKRELRGLKIVVFGATGVVGFASAVIAAREGAQVTIAGYDGPDRVAKSAGEIKHRFDVTVQSADGSTNGHKAALLGEAEVVFCAGPAGVRVLDSAQIDAAQHLLVVADVNAVPPSGIEGVDVSADASPIGKGGTVAIGALAVGRTKYQTEFGLFRRMIESGKPVTLDFQDAFALARDLSR